MTRNLLFSALLLLQTFAGCVRVAHAGGMDKLHHAVYSSAIYGASALIVNSKNHKEPDLLLPLVITLFFGLAKDVADPVFDPLDLVANTIGAGSAMGLFALTW